MTKPNCQHFENKKRHKFIEPAWYMVVAFTMAVNCMDGERMCTVVERGALAGKQQF